MGRIVDQSAPAERLAAFRIAVGVFVVVYLVGRSPVFLGLADRRAVDFDPVGLLSAMGEPPPTVLVPVAVALTVASAAAATIGWRHRITGVAAALGVLFLTTLRSSWGQLLHFENLMALQLIIVALSPSADAWSLDARAGRTRPDLAGVRYGWPLGLASLVMVVTYVIAGLAKLRYGGIEWIAGDTLRNHVAYSAARLDLIGGNAPILAEFIVRRAWVLPLFAFVAVAVELSAPVVFVGARSRNVWVAAAWLMHVGILVSMSVGFPSPLFGVAFAPLFPLEKLVVRGRGSLRRWVGSAGVGGV
ncbi:MAG: HTTM domain-containing protein [Ilumatobacter sp.]